MSDTDTVVNPTEKRVRSQTEKGMELYATNRLKHSDILQTLWENVETHLNTSPDPSTNLDDLYKARTELEHEYKLYKKVSYEYVDFLSRTNSTDSHKDLDAHNSLSQARELLVTTALTHIASRIQLALETVSRSHRSSKSETRSHKSSNVSDRSFVLAQVKAKAEAAKTKAEYADKEAVIKKRQAAIAEKQQLMAAQTARLQAELAADLECLQTQGQAAETAAEAQMLESINGVDSYERSSLQLPQDTAMERTRVYVEKHSASVYSTDIPKEIPAETRPTSGHIINDTALNLPHVLCPSDQPGADQTVTKFNVSHNQGIKSVLNPNADSYKPQQDRVSVLPKGQSETLHLPATTYQISPHTDSNYAVASELTNFLLKKELLLTRLTNFNDQPENYNSWKSGFLGVVTELNTTPVEQVDLLIRWLGPQSGKNARSIKAANYHDPSRALFLIWERLDERYGAAEMVESALKAKLECFPKLSNKDDKLLYELVDILTEIESLKENDAYRSLLAYFDSSSGVLPIARKLTYSLQEKWRSRASDYKTRYGVSFPPFSFFVSFVKEMSRMRNDPSFAYDAQTETRATKGQYLPKTGNTRVMSAKKTTDVTTNQKRNEETLNICPLHQTKHSLNDCRGFRTKHIEERKEIIRENGLCFRCCASKKHVAQMCNVQLLCKLCDSTQHPTCLHIKKVPGKSTEGQSRHGGESEKVNTKCTQICDNQFTGKSCSKTILVDVHPKGSPQTCRRMYAILDEQSNVSLAKSEFFDIFQEHGQATPYTLSSCNGLLQTTGRRAKDYVITALDGSNSIETPVIVECDQIPNHREEIPTPDIPYYHPHLSDVKGRIPRLDSDAEILLLIGRDVPEAHHVLKQLTGPRNTPYAQQLPLGWVIVGETCLGETHRPDFSVNKTYMLKSGQPSRFIPCHMGFNFQDKKYGEQDQPSDVFVTTKDDYKRGTSVEDRRFLHIMNEQTFKGPEGNWTAPLPFRTSRRRLPNNKAQAMKRAKTLHHSLERSPTKKEHFFEFMGKILDNGHAELAPPLKPDDERWYLPLFGVYHPKKPDQIRGVFDSSAKHEGVSLNDVLLTGPDLTNSLLGILLRFRREPVAITADVERMFYCFHVREDHRDFLRFLWYRENDFQNELAEYRMTVHVFGNSPSPAVATYGLRKAVQEGTTDQHVIDFVSNDFYVDDALTSLPTDREAIDLLKQTQFALSTGGNIRLHKIVSNSQKVMDAFPSTDHAKDLKNLDLGTDTIPLQRSLGLAWDVKTDTFTFQISSEQKPFTRRGVLSMISSLFDPLGFAAPIVIRGKMLLRELMSETRDWDEPMPQHREEEWEVWKNSLQAAQQLKIPRTYVKAADTKTDIRVYSDASEKAISAVAYMTTVDKTGKQNTSFLLGKAKLAPLHGHTIPRLELCATVLAVEIGETISEQLKVEPGAIRYYTDSKVVLGYLHNETRRFHVYVSNRVARVRRSSQPSQWGYVATEKNPADSATRNLPSIDVALSCWLQGPPETPCRRPENFPLLDPDVDREVRQVNVSKTHVSDSPLDTGRFQRFSTWKKLVGALARLKHVAETFRAGNSCKGWHSPCSEARKVTLLSDTEKLILKCVQAEVYQTEIRCIQEKKVLPKNSPIVSLSPILDDDGLLRVGGRLNRSPTGHLGKNPVIIPGKHHVALLLIRHHHEATRHQGRHITEGAVRTAGLWITGCKRLVSSLCQTCVKCRRQRAATSTQKMADLPPQRLTPAPPFTYVGVDAFGHWDIVTRKTRGGAASSKRWAIVFSCLVTRAIHIEVVEEMSASAFINAMRRFLAIRGAVKQFYSDRGTNFIGATKELAINTINVEDGPVRAFLDNSEVEWVFNPPHSSHMGGSWERMIRTTRSILNSMLVDVSARNLTHDILVTFLAEVCAIINARPLVPVSTDPESPFILSPNTLLTQKSDLPTGPLLEYNVADMYSKQWKRVQLLAEIFWKRWRREYLHLLQPRRKWNEVQRNFMSGDVVLLKDKEAHRNDWCTGIVVDAIKGSDGNVRKVVVRVSRDGKRVSYTRPISDLVLLLSK